MAYARRQQQPPTEANARAIQAAGLRAERVLAGRTLQQQAAVLSDACGWSISPWLIETWEHPCGAKPTSDIALLIHLLNVSGAVAVVAGMNASLAAGGGPHIPARRAPAGLGPAFAVNIDVARARSAAGRQALRWLAGRRVEAWASDWSDFISQRITREMVLAYEDPYDPRWPASHVGAPSYLMAGRELGDHVSLRLFGPGPLIV